MEAEAGLLLGAEDLEVVEEYHQDAPRSAVGLVEGLVALRHGEEEVHLDA